jgi:hypothetical protein
MLEQMYKRWLDEQEGHQEIEVDKQQPTIQITLTQTGDKR